MSKKMIYWWAIMFMGGVLLIVAAIRDRTVVPAIVTMVSSFVGMMLEEDR